MAQYYNVAYFFTFSALYKRFEKENSHLLWSLINNEKYIPKLHPKNIVIQMVILKTVKKQEIQHLLAS